MTPASPRIARRALLFAAVLLSGCAKQDTYDYGDDVPFSDQGGCWTPAVCNESIEIAPDSRALVVQDPEVLSQFRLEDVLGTLIARSGYVTTTPRELLRRLFDTSNNREAAMFEDNFHCDSPENPAHHNGPPAFCPRTEGVLATSEGFFDPASPDHFYPVAILNRFDVRPSGGSTCGQYRIVYAKASGLTDPEDRVFLIFEGVLPNPEPACGAEACRPVAEFWMGLDRAPTPRALAEGVRGFFFDGLPGFEPVLQPRSFGLGTPPSASAGYYGGSSDPGQVRISQHMDEHWEMREAFLNDDTGALAFVPVTVKNNPMPYLFDIPGVDMTSEETMNAELFQSDFIGFNSRLLAAPTVGDITMDILPGDNSGESALGGEAVNDYAARAMRAGNEAFMTLLQEHVDDEGFGADCPEDDPLTAESMVRRAMTQSCAGCHAPAQFLGEERKIGCGLVWPDSLGEVHIDEKGQLSPALKEVFLPRRAAELTTFLRGCSSEILSSQQRRGRRVH